MMRWEQMGRRQQRQLLEAFAGGRKFASLVPKIIMHRDGDICHVSNGGDPEAGVIEVPLTNFDRLAVPYPGIEPTPPGGKALMTLEVDGRRGPGQLGSVVTLTPYGERTLQHLKEV